MAKLIITIDGPAASGKSTAARLLAEKLGAAFLDTGAMYRAVALAAMQAGTELNNEEKLLEVLDNTKFEFGSRADGKVSVHINGVDCTKQIRTPAVTANSHYIASSAKIRKKMVNMQRRFADSRKKIVTEGRDQGTVVFPQADFKFFLTAELAQRAVRRQAELRDGDDSLEKIKTDIQARDESDRNRSSGPLKAAEDAIVVDTTSLSIEEVTEKLLTLLTKNEKK